MKCKHVIVYFKNKEECKVFTQIWRKIPNKSEYIKQIVKEYKKEK